MGHPNSGPGLGDLVIWLPVGSKLYFDSLPSPTQLNPSWKLMSWVTRGNLLPASSMKLPPRFPFLVSMNKDTAMWGPLWEGSV